MSINTHQTSGSLKSMMGPIQRFFHMEAAGGILLLISAAVAILWANSPWADAYFHLWEAHIAVEVGHNVLSMHLMHWINDGLMAIFFFVVGLEIKREVLNGELGSLRKAALPIAGAIGGMVVPALIYVYYNAGTPELTGWGVPMATDIAFALGVVILLGKRVPVSLKIFLTALAIVDDLGAVLVIAFFYTANLSVTSLVVAAAFFGLLIGINRLGVQHRAPYLALGLGLWLALLQSGVHATISGVLLAMTIPSNRLLSASSFLTIGRGLMYKFTGTVTVDQDEPTEEQVKIAKQLKHAVTGLESPMVRMEHTLHSWVALFIMPIFAFANAGVSFTGANLGEVLTNNVTLGIVLGLLVGKQIGVFGFSWLSVKLGIAEKPAGTTWRQFYGVSILAGIGFTMSLFIASLAFGEGATLDSAKLGILIASLIAGLAGWWILSTGNNQAEGDTPEATEETVLEAVPVPELPAQSESERATAEPEQQTLVFS